MTTMKNTYHRHRHSVSLSTIVQRFKGASSRLVRKANLPDVTRRLWGKAFWSPSYFIVSCGGAPLDIVKAYVDTQQQIHSHTYPTLEKEMAGKAGQRGAARLFSQNSTTRRLTSPH